MCGFQHWLKAKGSHNTVIIMSLKRVTSGSWGASSSTESHLFLSFAPRDTDNALSFHPTICPSFSWDLCVCVCAWGCGVVLGGVWGLRVGEQVAAIRKWMGNVLNGKLASIPHGVPGCLPFTSGPRGTARTGEMKWEQVVVCCLTRNGVPL